MLHGKPAIVAVSHVGMDAETELVDVEIYGLILIADVDTDHSNTLTYGTSIVSDRSTLSSASRRRFSETAVLRSGR